MLSSEAHALPSTPPVSRSPSVLWSKRVLLLISRTERVISGLECSFFCSPQPCSLALLHSQPPLSGLLCSPQPCSPALLHNQPPLPGLLCSPLPASPDISTILESPEILVLFSAQLLVQPLQCSQNNQNLSNHGCCSVQQGQET